MDVELHYTLIFLNYNYLLLNSNLKYLSFILVNFSFLVCMTFSRLILGPEKKAVVMLSSGKKCCK